MTDYNFGEILLLRFPHSEGVRESKRPVVVLAQTDAKDIVVSKVTSSDKRSRYDIMIDDYKKAGLLFPSVIRIDKLATLSKSRIIKKPGTLSSAYNARIKNKIKQLFDME